MNAKRKPLRKSKYDKLLRIDIFDGLSGIGGRAKNDGVTDRIFPPSMASAMRALRNMSSVAYFGILMMRPTADSKDWTQIATTPRRFS